MIKFAIGILIGASVAAVAQGLSTEQVDAIRKSVSEPAIKGMKEMYGGAVLMAAQNPAGNAAILRVDDKGRVYCSPEALP